MSQAYSLYDENVPAALVAEERQIRGSLMGSCVPHRDIPTFVQLYLAGRFPVNQLHDGDLRFEGFDKLAAGTMIRQNATIASVKQVGLLLPEVDKPGQQRTVAEDARSVANIDALYEAANLRDIGGALTNDGKRVRQGHLYRSGMLSSLSEDLIAHVGDLKLNAIIDFRAGDERQAFPTPWQAIGCADYWHGDHLHGSGDLARMLREPARTKTRDVRDLMISVYRDMPYVQATTLQAVFHRLAEERTPILFHCAAGKDRTGVAAALILAALNVPMDEILRDYLRTNEFDLRGSSMFRRGSTHRLAELKIPESLLAPILIADTDYLAAMFDSLIFKEGSIAGYVERVLGVGESQRQEIQRHLLEVA